MLPGDKAATPQEGVSFPVALLGLLGTRSGVEAAKHRR